MLQIWSCSTVGLSLLTPEGLFTSVSKVKYCITGHVLLNLCDNLKVMQ